MYRVPGTDFHLVSSWAAVLEAADRTTEFSSHLTAVLVDRPGGTPATFDLDSTGTAVQVLATADAETHAAHRGIVGPALATRVRAAVPRLRALAETLWDDALDGDRLDWATGTANRDPAAFPDPGTLDLFRPRTRAGLAFGRGAHFCLGSAPARAEATAALTLLLERTAWFDLDPAVPPRWVPSLLVRRHASLPLRITPHP